jgi:hypothetical protein
MNQLLLRQIFLSEIDYQIFVDMLNVINDLPLPLSDEDEAKKIFCEEKIAHDNEVISIWLNKLKQEDSSFDINSTENQEIRSEVLNEAMGKVQDHYNGISENFIAPLNEKTIVSPLQHLIVSAIKQNMPLSVVNTQMQQIPELQQFLPQRIESPQLISPEKGLKIQPIQPIEPIPIESLEDSTLIPLIPLEENEIRQDSYDEQINHWQEVQTEAQKKIDAIVALSNGGFTWQQ